MLLPCVVGRSGEWGVMGSGSSQQVMLKGEGSVTVEKSAASSNRKELRCSQRVFPRTHEPSVTIARCLFAAAPRPTVRPPASASPHTSSADAAGQANFLRCRSGDIFQVERCTLFRAPDHGTHTRTRIFARVSGRFVEMGGTNLHTQTLTSHAILVDRIDGLVGCFSK